MYDVNVKRFVEPLVNRNWNKKDRNILDRLRITLKDCLYFRCLGKIFPNYREFIFMSLINGFKFKKYKPKEVLINYNDIVNKIYFIILGKINIYKISIPKIQLILESLCNKQKNVDKRKQILDYFNIYVKRYLNTISEKSIFLDKMNSNNNANNKKHILKISYASVNINRKKSQLSELESFYRVIINHNKEYDFSLEEGKIFGEEFIYNNVKYSNCIVESDGECIIGELGKEDYEKIYKRINVIERSNITAFLVNLKIFNSSNFFLPKLQRCLIKRNFAKNEIIFKQNDPYRTFYVIRKGKVGLNVEIPKKVKCQLEPEIIMGNSKNKRFTNSNIFVVKGNYIEKNEYNLLTVTDGEFIGEIEYYKNKDKYMYTAQCLEDDCIVFEFDLFLFEHLLKENKSINSNLNGFFEKIKEKMALFQERLYSMRKSGSAIKKSDYVLSKDKFTRNLLQNNPIKEDESKKFINTSMNQKNNKTLKREINYLNFLSPFLKRHISINRNKKFIKIQINKEFFNSRNLSKEEKIFSSKSTSKTKNKSKDRNISSANTSKNLSKFMVYSSNIYSKINSNTNTSRENIENTNRKENNKIKTNKLLKDDINIITKLNTNKNSVMNNIIFNHFNKRNSYKKLNKITMTNFNNTNNSDNEKSFDFVDPNLDLIGNNRIKNIPIILKETKNSKRYKNIYDKDRIKKINSFYFESPKNTRFQKLLIKQKKI